MEKPVISIDFLDQFQKTNTDSKFIDKAIYKVNYRTDFSKIIEKALYDKNTREKLINKQNSQIKDYLLKSNGWAYKHIAEEIIKSGKLKKIKE